ncbi:putative deoxycytidine kinase [Auxenochlorella protothecoides]|uniref:Putative deoxycytidine kinase n=1 Tax=Auxenochlorella protothecoides TaxID=3075 RepID=A0A087SND5_AUXPR|nr:putative deoxycytidine kinase [Auxenochlorella protothecoides]KFM27239.1 putative deoxycytidine kinase [Auxenochlorella protothecoides]
MPLATLPVLGTTAAAQRAVPSRLRGVGRTYEALLSAHAIDSIAALQDLYHTSLGASKDELQRFLAEVVGIRNSHHRRTVAEHVSALTWQAEAERAQRVTLAVEGNIGAGKSTFLNIMADQALELQDIIEVVPEPVEEWQSVAGAEGGEGPVNLLDRFYKDPQRYAYTFQHYVLLTRMQKERDSRSGLKPLRVLERSIFSDRMVFVRAMHESGFLQDMEVSIYDSWFNMEIGNDKLLTPNGFIYLKASPDTCIQRLRHRARAEEVGVSEEYLGSLHDKHEDWLHFGARTLSEVVEAQRHMLETVTRLRRDKQGHRTSPILEAATMEEGGEASRLRFTQPAWLVDAPASIKGNIYFLKGRDVSTGDAALSLQEDKIVNTLRDVPALMLEHGQSDILHDPEARQDYARKVKDFSEYVAKLQSAKRTQLLTQRGTLEPLACSAAFGDDLLSQRLAALNRERPRQSLLL